MPRPLVGFARNAAAALCIALGSIVAACSDDDASASEGRASAAKQLPAGSGFDFWVLSLSWSPSYCAIEGEDANRGQCAGGRRLGFVVHGLWPQFEKGWPEYCASDGPRRVPDALVRDYLDIMPSAGLIGHQWRKHGSCSGLSQRDYLQTVRTAWERVALPPAFFEPVEAVRIDPDDVEAAFIGANASLPSSGITVTCDGGYIEEVRICMSRTLEFRPCPQVDARGCEAPSARMPEPG